MDTTSFKVIHDKGCFWEDLPEGLCDCMKKKLVELFTLLDELTDENYELKKLLENKK